MTFGHLRIGNVISSCEPLEEGDDSCVTLSPEWEVGEKLYL